MPFTFSHSAAALLFRKSPRRWINMEALVVGCMAPDFGYYINAMSLGIFSHYLIGSILCGIPIGLIFLGLYEKFKMPFIYSLPTSHREFLSEFLAPVIFTKRALPSIIMGILMGTWTHIIWDGFTHGTGFFVTIWPILKMPINFYIVEWPLYKMLQHTSTLFGFMVLVYFYLQNYQQFHKKKVITQAFDIKRVLFWLTLFTLSTIMSFLWVSYLYPHINDYEFLLVKFVIFSVCLLAIFGFSALSISFKIKLFD